MTCKEIAARCPAYLSGEMEPESARVFAEHLRNCRACNEEVERQITLDSLLRRSILSEKVDTTALDRTVRAHIALERRSFSPRWLAVAAGIAAILLAGALSYRAMFASPPPKLCVDAARDHRSEVTLAQHRRWLSDPNAVADLGQRNGIPASLLAALVPPGYRFEHGKLCRLGGEVFLHLVYAQGGAEFSVYLRSSGTQSLSLQQVQTGGEHIAYVRTDRYTAMFVTDRSSAAALSLARSAAPALIA
ncbi:MAG TPA: zf-HC2 domain-containing protein [Bryobacteraceae bacterium]|jgi:anti-sigma factor RsiW|nr:zf-HC2 domain-containing protein [Bryobacteraceae bacterium]